MADFRAYHRSLQAELTAIKDRVRNLIHHWPTDGAFKESALRSVLRRHLPESLFIGSGFVVTADRCSRQIDVLIVDKECPRLFWDGDLVIVTPEAVRAAIEVKTGLDSPSDIETVILAAAENKTVWRRALYGWQNYLGVFIYEARGDHEAAILSSLEKARTEHDVAIDCVAFGEDVIVDLPGKIGNREFKGWVARQTDGMAAACFVGNLIGYFAEAAKYSNQSAWQPLMNRDSVLKYIEAGGDRTIEDVSVESCFDVESDQHEKDDG